jgi:hypothetical protein
MIIFCECMNDDLCQTSDYFHHILSSFIHKTFKLLPNILFWVWFFNFSIYKFNLNVKYWIYKGFQISFCCIHQFLLNKKFLPMNPMWHPTKVCLLIILLNDTRNYVAIGLSLMLDSGPNKILLIALQACGDEHVEKVFALVIVLLFVAFLGILGVARLYKNKIMICNYILIVSWSLVCCMNTLCLTYEATTNIKHCAFQLWIVVLIGIKIFAHEGSLSILLNL